MDCQNGHNNEYRPLSSVSDDQIDVAHLRGGGGTSHNSVKRKTEIVTTGRRHNFEIQPSRYRGGHSQSHLGQLPSIEGASSALATSAAAVAAATAKTGHKNSEYP